MLTHNVPHWPTHTSTIHIHASHSFTNKGEMSLVTFTAWDTWSCPVKSQPQRPYCVILGETGVRIRKELKTLTETIVLSASRSSLRGDRASNRGLRRASSPVVFLSTEITCAKFGFPHSELRIRGGVCCNNNPFSDPVYNYCWRPLENRELRSFTSENQNAHR